MIGIPPLTIGISPLTGLGFHIQIFPSDDLLSPGMIPIFDGPHKNIPRWYQFFLSELMVFINKKTHPPNGDDHDQYRPIFCWRGVNMRQSSIYRTWMRRPSLATLEIYQPWSAWSGSLFWQTKTEIIWKQDGEWSWISVKSNLPVLWGFLEVYSYNKPSPKLI